MDYPLSIPACCRASGNRNWEDAGMSFLRDSGITGYALLIKSMRRRTTVYRRVTFAGIGQFPESTLWRHSWPAAIGKLNFQHFGRRRAKDSCV